MGKNGEVFPLLQHVHIIITTQLAWNELILHCEKVNITPDKNIQVNSFMNPTTVYCMIVL